MENSTEHTDLSSPRPPPTVTARQMRMAVQGKVDTRRPYQVKNFSREVIIPFWHQRTETGQHWLVSPTDTSND